MPQRRISPFVSLGGGIVQISPKATIVQSEDRTDPAAYSGLGLRGYLTNRFLLQAEYRKFVVLTSRDDNEEIDEWTVGFMKGSNWYPRYEEVARKIDDAITFMAALGLNPDNTPALRQTSFFTSHEALLLGYEEALTRRDSITNDWYATSGHMLWIGDRTRQPDAAHVEYFAGIRNPIGIKCGPSLTNYDFLRLLYLLNPTD